MRVWKLLLILCIVTLSGCSVRSSLTQAERDYIHTHTVVWAAGDTYYPFMYVDKNSMPHGIAIDYMALITRRTGLQFRMGVHGQLPELLSALKSGQVDMVPSIRTTPERAAYASFTRPFILVDLVLLKRIRDPKTVGVAKSSAARVYLSAARKDLAITEYEDNTEAYRALMDGRIDSCVMDVMVATALANRFDTEFDKSSVPFEYPLSFATAKDNIILRSIIDKALNSLSIDEQERIRIKWI